MATKKTSVELRSEADKLQERLTALRKEARKAERAEKAKAQREQREREKEEAVKLIDISKKLSMIVRNENGEKESVSVYEFLKREMNKQMTK